ncbi:hypothetical protein JFQ92_001438 [Edwardsiella piscicida]|uniref:hypothetical protein n=2 Tax=Edwardsiella TaxID=635 RepID=UPI000D512C8D|nr:hypothetical protein [Edwardsiella piscicida]EKS7766367.1 hypothetical protein [Edwardsiella piscicida]UCQ43792.1 hypothetical protein DCF39_13585 [Edwardsiella piscicida]
MNINTINRRPAMYNQFQQYKSDCALVDSVIGQPDPVYPNTADSRTLSRASRVKTGLSHLLRSVLPKLKEQSERVAVSSWLQGINELVIADESGEPGVMPMGQVRERLMRAKAGLYHFMTAGLLLITDSGERNSVYLWVDGIYTLTRIEELEMVNGQSAEVAA